MPIEMQTVEFKLDGGTTNIQTATFSDTVVDWVYAMAGFGLQYEKNHHVSSMGVDISSQGPSGKLLTMTATFTLNDKHGTKRKPAKGTVVSVVVIAVTGSSNPYLTLANVKSIDNGKTATVKVGQSSMNPQTAMLSGFELSFGSSTDHYVNSVTLGASISGENTNEREIAADATIKDGHGDHKAELQTIDAGYIGRGTSSGATPTEENSSQDKNRSEAQQLLVTTVPHLQWKKDFSHHLSAEALQLDAGKTIKQAVVVMNSMKVTYGGNTDHSFHSMGASAVLSVDADGRGVTVDGTTTITDGGSGHWQDNNESFVGTTVIALTD